MSSLVDDEEHARRDAVMEQWDLREETRIIREELGLKAGWERAKAPSGRSGYRGVLRKKRRVEWRSEWVTIDAYPERALSTAIDELHRRAFDRFKANHGIR